MIRWLEIALLTGIYFILLEVVLSFGWQRSLLAFVDNLSHFAGIGMLVLASALFWVFGRRLGAFAFSHFASVASLSYPPIWISVVFASSLSYFTGLVKSPEEISVRSLVSPIAIVGAGLLVVYLFDLVHETWTKSFSVSTDAMDSGRDAVVGLDAFDGGSAGHDLLAWIWEERPIASPADDQFGHAVAARQIAADLMAGQSSNFGVTGDFGSGKSSVVNLVKRYVASPIDFGIETEPKQQIVFIDVDTWGRREDDIPKQILQLAVEQLQQHIDVTAITGLPAAYQEALMGGHSLLRGLGSIFFDGAPDPSGRLRRLDNMLALLNMRFVFVLEDLDRAVDSQVGTTPAFALLDRLRDLQHISFLVTADAATIPLATFQRIFHQTKRVAADINDMKRVLLQFRGLCLAAFPDDVDVMSRKTRDDRLEVNFPEDAVRRWDLRREAGTLIFAICTIAKTPRTLKVIMRHVWKAWQNLHGEIDFDHLLVATTLQFGGPEAFEFVHMHVEDLRALPERERPPSDQGMFSGESHRTGFIDSRWEQVVVERVVQRVGPTFNPATARALVQFLFPQWANADIYGPRQGVHVGDPVDYWKRLLRGDLNAGEVRDQDVLRLVHAWPKARRAGADPARGLMEGLFGDKEFVDRLWHLTPGVWSDDDVRQIGSRLFEKILIHHGAAANYHSSPGPLALRALATFESDEIASYQNWIVDELEKALDVSFAFANAIYIMWDRLAQFPTRPLPPMRSRYIELVKRAFVNNPRHFLDVLDQKEIYASFQLVFVTGDEDPDGDGVNGDEWRWFADVLLSAAELDAHPIVGQLAGLLVQRDPIRDNWVLRPRRKLASTMFGHKPERLLRVLSTDVDVSAFEPEHRTIVQFVRQLSSELSGVEPE